MNVKLRLDFTRFALAAAFIIAVDAMVLPAARHLTLYPPVELHIPYALGAYVILSLALSSIHTERPILAGALVGLLVYGVFNATELALRADWRQWYTPTFDVTYGTALCAATSALVAATRV